MRRMTLRLAIGFCLIGALLAHSSRAGDEPPKTEPAGANYRAADRAAKPAEHPQEQAPPETKANPKVKAPAAPKQPETPKEVETLVQAHRSTGGSVLAGTSLDGDNDSEEFAKRLTELVKQNATRCGPLTAAIRPWFRTSAPTTSATSVPFDNEIVDTLRDAAMKLDAKANRIEKARQYAEADQYRKYAHELRMLARAIDQGTGVPMARRLPSPTSLPIYPSPYQPSAPIGPPVTMPPSSPAPRSLPAPPSLPAPSITPAPYTTPSLPVPYPGANPYAPSATYQPQPQPYSGSLKSYTGSVKSYNPYSTPPKPTTKPPAAKPIPAQPTTPATYSPSTGYFTPGSTYDSPNKGA